MIATLRLRLKEISARHAAHKIRLIDSPANFLSLYCDEDSTFLFFFQQFTFEQFFRLPGLDF